MEVRIILTPCTYCNHQGILLSLEEQPTLIFSGNQALARLFAFEISFKEILTALKKNRRGPIDGVTFDVAELSQEHDQKSLLFIALFTEYCLDRKIKILIQKKPVISGNWGVKGYKVYLDTNPT